MRIQGFSIVLNLLYAKSGSATRFLPFILRTTSWALTEYNDQKLR